MLKFKKGERVRITKPVLVRRKDGTVEIIRGKIVTVTAAYYRKSRCDIGLEKPVLIPNTHLELEVAA